MEPNRIFPEHQNPRTFALVVLDLLEIPHPFLSTSSFCNGNVYSVSAPALHLEAFNLSGFTGSQLLRNFAKG